MKAPVLWRMYKLYLAQRPKKLDGQALHRALMQAGLPVCSPDCAPLRKTESAWAWHLAALAILESAGRLCPVQKDKNGWPFLLEAAGPYSCLSLSHTGNWAAVCLSDHPCGVDIETIRPWKMAAARRLCTPKEWQFAMQKDPEERDACFTSVFVQKEACAKAWGIGLAAMLGQEAGSPSCQLELGSLLVCVMELDGKHDPLPPADANRRTESQRSL